MVGEPAFEERELAVKVGDLVLDDALLLQGMRRHAREVSRARLPSALQFGLHFLGLPLQWPLWQSALL